MSASFRGRLGARRRVFEGDLRRVGEFLLEGLGAYRGAIEVDLGGGS